MTTTLPDVVAEPTPVAPAPPERGLLHRPKSTTGFWSWWTTVDHKKIGILYGATALIFIVIAGIEALLIRLQLAGPNGTVLTASQYNTLFTMHGTTMVFLVGMPLASAFGNYLIPLQIGARDVAFPRLNMFGFWVFLFGGLFIYSGFVLGGAPNGGWFGYTPLTSTPMSAGLPPRPRSRLLGRRARDARHRLGHDRCQLRRDHPQHARARHDAHAHAGVRVDDAGGRVPHGVRDAVRHRRADHGLLRPQLLHELLRGGRGR